MQFHSGTIIRTTIAVTGTQVTSLDAYAARTDQARITQAVGLVTMSFGDWAQVVAVAEALAAARAAALDLPTDLSRGHHTADAERQALSQTVITWQSAPGWAVTPQAVQLPTGDTRRALDLHLGPLTVRILDRAALNSLIAAARDAQRLAAAVFLDAPTGRVDPLD